MQISNKPITQFIKHGLCSVGLDRNRISLVRPKTNDMQEIILINRPKAEY